MNINWFPIFKGGKQTDSNGVEHDGNELIDKAVSSLDINKHEPPIVLGHRKDNSPAFGWVEGLKKQTENGALVLYAKVKQALPEFVDWLKKGLYKKRSASFYPDGRLRHIGFLGAFAPAVKGLPNIFKEDEKCILFEEDNNVKDEKSLIDKVITGVVEGLKDMFDFSATAADKKAQQSRSKQYGIAVKENNSNVTKPSEWVNIPDSKWLDPVNYRYPMQDDAHIRNAAARWAQVKPGDYTPAETAIINKRLDDAEKAAKIGKYRGANMAEKFEFTEQELQAKIADATKKATADAVKAANEKSKAEFAEATKKASDEAAKAERKKVLAEFAETQKKEKLEQSKKELKSFVEELTKEGKLIPAWKKAGIVSFMESLNDSSEPVEFSEGKKESKLEWFKNFLSGMDKIVDFKEIAKDGKQAKKSDYSEFGNAVIDEDRADLDTKVKAYMKANKVTDYSEALNRVIELEA